MTLQLARRPQQPRHSLVALAQCRLTLDDPRLYKDELPVDSGVLFVSSILFWWVYSVRFGSVLFGSFGEVSRPSPAMFVFCDTAGC